MHSRSPLDEDIFLYFYLRTKHSEKRSFGKRADLWQEHINGQKKILTLIGLILIDMMKHFM